MQPLQIPRGCWGCLTDLAFGTPCTSGILHLGHLRSLCLALQASMHTCPNWWRRCPRHNECSQTATSLPMPCLGRSGRGEQDIHTDA